MFEMSLSRRKIDKKLDKHDTHTNILCECYVLRKVYIYDAKNYNMEILASPAYIYIFTLHIAAGSGIEQQTSRRCKRSINIK